GPRAFCNRVSSPAVSSSLSPAPPLQVDGENYARDEKHSAEDGDRAAHYADGVVLSDVAHRVGKAAHAEAEVRAVAEARVKGAEHARDDISRQQAHAREERADDGHVHAREPAPALSHAAYRARQALRPVAGPSLR